ncbi:hypothetical protein SAMN05443667_111142 [Flavobacterium gillisiae]|uniref:Gliding motility-associated C-terminal domain-containing protein n=1 Tax=Flavobacterium gillisiae TaxID=150146 RepID=A0A1H4F2A8_9FLAO|nr:PKD-like domain-containing protein [Flavobacterium gillisiae]SEA91110.1 hypothetical protein SAMN05443667_111142 [Flavobacterium gillisiae]
MKRNYSKLHKNSTLVISALRAYHMFLLVMIALFICDNGIAQTISSFTPASACASSGTLVTINGTGFTGTSSVKFNGDSSSFTVDSDTQISASLPLTATTGQIEVTSLSGYDTSSIFTVNTLSVAPTSISGTTIICNGNSTTLTLNGGSAGTTAIAEWFSSSCGGTPIGTGNSILVSPSTATTYFVRYNGTCNTTICASTTVTVNPIIFPAVSIAANTGSSICAGTTVIFTATPSNGGSSPSYQWFVGPTPVGTNSATYTTSTLTNGNQVKVVMTSNATCPIPTTATSNILTMTINTLLVPSVTIAATQTTFCVGTSVTFNVNTLINGGLSPTYQWRLNGNPVGTNSASFTSNALSNNDNVTLDVTSSATCPSPSMVTSNAIQVTVNPEAAISLTSGGGSNNQTLCANSLLPSITFAISGGGTGAVVTGLPVGLIGSFSGGAVTISGTPTVSGSFTYTVTTTGTCVQKTATGVITVNPIATISLTSGSGTNNQNRCINVPLSTISFAISGGGTGAVVTGLPAGVNGTFSGGVFTISGTPTAIGSFLYTVTTTGSCAQTTATGTITVNPDAAISLASGPGTINQTLCTNTLLTNISYAISGGGTGANATGLPAGISGSFSGSTFTISGTPTVSGTFPYTVTTTGSCVQITASGTITVTPDAAITLASGGGTNNQTRCVNVAISNITFSVSGGGTGAGVTGLPTGLSGNLSGSTFTISGIPTTVGTYNYIVTTTGTCAQTTAIGTIIVSPDAAISLTSAAGTNNQTLCANTILPNISYAISGGGTGAVVTVLPAGLTGIFNSGIFTISGTPTISGSFPYTITTTGSCIQATATGTITVNPNAAISLTSGGGTNNQTRCINVVISTITFAVSGGGTGATVTGLPSGVNGIYSGGIFTISGTPTVAGIFNYTVSTTGSCAQTTATGTITVNPDAAISLTSGPGTNNQTLCANTLMTNISFAISGGATGAGITGLPTGLTGSYSGGVFTINGTPTVSGSFLYTVTTAGSCAQSTGTGTITVNPIAAISLTSGAGTNNQTRCINFAVSNITFAISGGATGAGVTGLPTGLSGTLSGSTFTISGSSTAVGTFNYIVTTTGSCTQTTANGTITVNPVLVPSVTITSTTTSICSTAGASVTFTATPVNGGTTPTYQWRRNGTAISGATSSIYTTSLLADPSTISVVLTSNATCASPLTTTSNDILMTVFSGSPSVPNGNNASNKPSGPTSICPPATGLVYNIPSNMTGGETYVWSLPAGFNITSGAGTSQITVSIAINAAIGNNNISVTAYNPCGNSGPSRDLVVSVNSFNGVTVPSATQSVCSNGSITVVGTLTGAAASGTWSAPSGTFSNIISDYISNPKTVTATYTPAITSGNVILTITTNTPSGGGCPNVAGTSQINLTVNPRPTSIISGSATLCNSSSTPLSVALTGTQPWSLTYFDGTTSTNVTGITTSPYVFNPSPSSTKTYTVTALSDANCISIAGDRTGSAIVTVNPRPTSLISTTAGPICNGIAKQISIALTGSQPWSLTYTDGTTPVIVSGITTSPYTFNASPSTTKTYSVTSLADANCSSQSGDRSGSAIVTVNPRPTSIISTPASAICNGGSKTISISLTGSQPWNLTYTDGITPVTVTGIASSPYTFNVSPTIASTTYTVSALNDTNCTSQAADRTGSATVLVNARPTSIISGSATVCNGSTTPLSVALTGSQPWSLTYFDGTTSTNITGITSSPYVFSPSPSSTKTYTITALSDANCTAIAADRSGNALITVNARPTALISTTAGAICNGISKQISIVLTGSQPWSLTYTDGVTPVLVSGITTSPYTFNTSPSNTTTYTVSALADANCSSQSGDLSGSAIVTVNARPTSIITTTAAAICNGGTKNISITLSGSQPWNLTYTDGITPVSVIGITSSPYTFNVSPTIASTIYTVTALNDGNCTSMAGDRTGTATVVVNPRPTSIINGSATICDGSSTPLSVALSGTQPWSLTYFDGTSSTNITGITTSPYVFNLSPTTTKTYAITALSDANCTTIASDRTGSATVTVNQPSIASTSIATSISTICNGSSVTLTQTGGSLGTGASWNWYSDASYSTLVGNSVAANASLSVNPTTTTAYYLRAESSTATPCATNVPVTGSVTITVNQPVIISAHPAAAQTLCSGGTASFSVSASGTGLNYQWRKGTINLVNGVNIAGATSPTLTLSNLQTTDAANNYNVLITGTSPCTSATSNNSILIINRLVAINTQPSNVGVCVSNPATFGIVASGDGLTYQWYKGTIGSGVAVVNSANITGATTNVLNFAQAALTDDGPYYAIVSGIAPCSAITSNQVTLNVDQSITITSQPISKTVCEDTPNVSFSVIANVGGDPLTYQWRKNSVNIVGSTAPTFTISTATLTAAGNYDVVISGPSGYTCSSIQSVAATLTINPKPIGSATAQTICSGSATNVALNSTVIGTTFTWTAAIQTNPTAGTITGFSGNSGNPIIQTLINTGTTTGIIRYTVTPTANSCIGIAFTVDVTVNPAPIGSASAQTICSGSTTNVALNSTVIGTTFTWIPAIQTTPTGGTITGFSNGSVNTIAQSLSNTGTTAGIIRYTVTPMANSCPGTAFTVDVTINPNSTIVLSSVSGSDNPTNCVNTVLNISYAIGGGGTNASITAGALPAGVSGTYNSGTRVFTISGTPSSVGTFSYTVTTQGLCSNPSLSGTITVNPDSTINLSLGTGTDNQTKCINTAITPIKYTINNGGTNPTISWNPGPANFTGSYDTAAGVYTISGSSLVAGNYNYTVTTAGTCINSSLSGTITVNPNPAGSATTQIICSGLVTNVPLNSTVSGTTYTWTAVSQVAPTGGTITGFGSGSGASIAQVLTNTGTSAGTIRYTVTPTANSCPGPAFTVDVTVNPKPSGSATAQTICSGLSTNVALSSIVTGTTFTWTAAILTTPSGGTINGFSDYFGNTITQSLTNNGTTAGVVRYTVTPTANSCSGTVFTVDVTINAATVGGTTTISSTTNPSNGNNGTTRLTDCHSSAGVINLNGNVGTVIRWESSTDAGNTWIPKGNAGSLTYAYTGITATTIFRAVIQNGTCTIANSGISSLFIIPNIKPSPVSAIPSTICEGESSQLTSDSGFSSSQNLASGGLFNTANPPGWTVDNGNFPANGDNGTNNGFSETNGNAGDEYDSGDGKFAIVRGNRDSFLRTPTFDLIGLASANLTFDHAYKLNDPGAYAEVRLSLDGGATFPVKLTILTGILGPKNKFTTLPNKMSLDLNPYLGYTNLKLEFFFHGTVNNAGKQASNIGSTWALDNVQIPQAPDPLLTSQWKNLNTNAIISVTNSTRVTVTPPVTTTYEVTSFLNGCTSYGVDGTSYVTVTVNKRPTANIGPDQTICYDGTATFSVALTGVAPWTITYTNGTTPTTVTGINASPYIFSVPNLKANITYTITSLNDKNCTPFPGGITGSATVNVLTGRAGWWTGLVSTDWFDCKNWEQGLPSFTIDANILPYSTNGNRLPVIDKTSLKAVPYAGIASAKDMIINSNGSVTMVNNSELQISGNWRNSGVFIPGTGTVTFNGATTNQIQTINNTIKTNETFNNLTTNNTGGAKGISLVDKFELTVSNNLSLLSGDIRLTGEAQLVQAGTSANPASGTGKLLIDQQGQKNSFNYNYWSSPVSTNNSTYSIGGILRDGSSITNTFTDLSNYSPGLITFGDGAYFADLLNSGSIKISNRWLWSYNSQTLNSNTDLQDYNLWNYIGSTGTIKIGEGFTMKGTGGTAPITSLQNYVFVGKPNSGTIPLSLLLNQTYLVGNPYPSALDANEFILDNLQGRAGANIFNGALYFWDHFGLSNNHLLAEYQGGYATYSLTGGVPAIADSPLTATTTNSAGKVPGRYIPVAQGFFVDAELDPAISGTTTSVQGTSPGFNLNFKNSQRKFWRESTGNSQFMKTVGSKKTIKQETVSDTRSKIRLGFDSPIGAHRQLLLGADSNTTNAFDIGYDAPMFDMNDNDMYWALSNSQFVIQAIPNFNDDQIIPLGIIIANEGEIGIKIDDLENVPSTTIIYLYDNVTEEYYNIRQNPFKIKLVSGDYNNRFSLRFTDRKLTVEDYTRTGGIIVYFTNNTKVLNINNPFIDATISTVSLFNTLGQSINNWDVEDRNQGNIKIPIKNLPSGVYIVKMKTTKGDVSKKIIIK